MATMKARLRQWVLDRLHAVDKAELDALRESQHALHVAHKRLMISHEALMRATFRNPVRRAAAATTKETTQ